jgi:hypothetical protein
VTQPLLRHYGGVRWDLLRSSRRRRRVVALAGLLAAGAVAAVLVLTFGNPKQPKEHFDTGTVETLASDRQVPFTAERRRAVLAVVRKFVATAVARRNVGASYDLVAPDLRAGMTRRAWARGDIPVSPYRPASGAVSVALVRGSYAHEVDLNIALAVRPGSGAQPLGAEIYLRATGTGARRRWLVDGFLPSQTLGAAAPPPVPKGRHRATAAPKEQPDPGIGPHLSTTWLLVPLAIFALVVLGAAAALVERRTFADAIRRGAGLARADYVHALGGIAALVVTLFLSGLVLVLLLHGFGDQAVRAAAVISLPVLSPVFLLGTALLYLDQAARVVDSGTRPRRRRDADVHSAFESDGAGRSDVEVEP